RGHAGRAGGRALPDRRPPRPRRPRRLPPCPRHARRPAPPAGKTGRRAGGLRAGPGACAAGAGAAVPDETTHAPLTTVPTPGPTPRRSSALVADDPKKDFRRVSIHSRPVRLRGDGQAGTFRCACHRPTYVDEE